MESSSQTSRGYQEPYLIQFSVFLANRVGQLRDMLELFHGGASQIVGLSIVDSTDWAVVRAVFTDAGSARRLLAEAHLPFTESQVIPVELPKPQTLTRICEILVQAEINVHFAYTLAIKRNENPVIALHVDDPDLATDILRRHGMTLLGESDLAQPE